MRPPTALSTPNPLDELSPDDLDDELCHLDLLGDDVGPWSLPADVEPHDSDRLGERISHTDTDWTLDLADSCPWQPIPV